MPNTDDKQKTPDERWGRLQQQVPGLNRKINLQAATIRDHEANVARLLAENASLKAQLRDRENIAAQDFDDFWAPLIFDGPDVPQNVKDELHDFHTMMRVFSEVYVSITGGRFSKLMYDPAVIISAFEEIADRQAKEHAEEVTQELRAEIEALQAEMRRLKLECQSSIGFS